MSSQASVRPSPFLTLSRIQLVILICIFSIVPPVFVVSMVYFFPSDPELKLDVEVSLGETVYSPRKDPDSHRILPCVNLRNPTSERWQKVAVSINEVFYYYLADSIESGGTVVMPVEFFVTKSGNVAFQPGSELVEQVTVFAQVPNGSRAVAEKYYDKLGRPSATKASKTSK